MEWVGEGDQVEREAEERVARAKIAQAAAEQKGLSKDKWNTHGHDPAHKTAPGPDRFQPHQRLLSLPQPPDGA